MEELVEVLIDLDKKGPPVLVPPPARKRREAKKMVMGGSIAAAVANTLAVLAEHGAQYGDLLDEIASRDEDDESLLIRLETSVLTAGYDLNRVEQASHVPSSLVASYHAFRENPDLRGVKAVNICAFLRLHSTENNFSGNSDDFLCRRLQTSVGTAAVAYPS
jgi:hypothetical protein